MIERPAAGLLDALRSLAGSLRDTVEVRGALFAMELRQEVRQRVRELVLAVIALGLLHVVLILLAVLVAMAFWESHRLAAVAGVAILYAAAAAAALVALRHTTLEGRVPFAASRRELAQDFLDLRAP